MCFFSSLLLFYPGSSSMAAVCGSSLALFDAGKLFCTYMYMIFIKLLYIICIYRSPNDKTSCWCGLWAHDGWN